MSQATDHYKNSAYTHTSFGFFWYSSPLAKPVFALTGTHFSGPAKPPPGHWYHFGRSAESAWYRHIAPRMEEELAQKGRVSFYTGHNGWTVLGPGFIEITDRHGKLSRFVAGEIGRAALLGRLAIVRPGVEFNPLDYSNHEGVYRFDQTAHNVPMFRYLFKRCLGVDL